MRKGHLCAGSMASSVVEFFRRNPDEELTTEDIRLKYTGDNANVSKRLRRMVDGGVLVSKRKNRKGVKGGGTMTVYTAGPKLLEAMQ